jgi:hypothetical protein
MNKGLIALTALASAAMAAELPVRTVILYKHGVGYFERSGPLASGESARLDFKASDMNDVLKSLTIEDRSGARITGLRYDASEPLEKRLADYPFQIGSRQALSQFLDQLKGARLEIQLAGQTLAGAIFGARVVAVGEKAQEREQVTIMLDSGELRTFDLSSISSIKLFDPALERQLKDYLAALAVSRSREKRSIYIDSTDTRTREVRAAYMIPTPVWKSSYRLILKETGSMLEGWAIVDNTTGEDWTNVNLALVSGRPISFISRLYEPSYRIRQVAELPEERTVGPVVHSGAVQMADERAAMARRAPAAPAPPASQALRLEGKEELAAAKAAMDFSSVAATAAARELGDLFEYRFSTPVTVRKSESAMFPFLQQKIGARKLLIYSDRSLQNPMNAAEITNDTGKTLDGGPVTVLESGAYAGEALVETLKAQDKRLISYGIDLGTRITTNLDSQRRPILEILALRGVLSIKWAMEDTTTYTIRNVDAKAKTLVIEHPIRQEFKVINRKPVESTVAAHRFEVKLAPAATEKFPVVEEHVFEEQLRISNLTPDQIQLYLANKALSPDGRKHLESVKAQKAQIAETDRQIRAVETDITELVRDQERIRQNLASLNRVSGQQEQVQKYAKELADQESKLASLRDRLSQLRRQRDQQQAALNSFIEKIEF